MISLLFFSGTCVGELELLGQVMFSGSKPWCYSSECVFLSANQLDFSYHTPNFTTVPFYVSLS
jgi:hypothetical protein